MPAPLRSFRVRFRSLLIAIPLCVVAALAWSTIAAADVVVEEAVTYGRVGDVELKLDVAYPRDGSGPFPGILFVHGGAWAGGERTAYRGLIERAARNGYVAAQISYRVTGYNAATKTGGEVPFPAQLEDCKCAVRWMRSVSDRYHIDPNRIGITGGSAGGHLSLMVGLVGEDAGLEGTGGHPEYSSRVQCVVNYCGPTDLVHEYEQVEVVQPFLAALCGGTPDTAAEAYRVASPISYLSSDDPPILTLHGDQDNLVPVAQARLLDEKMKAAGLQHELLVLEGQGHAIKSAQADAAFWRFFDTHLKGK